VRNLGQKTIFQWLGKIFYGLLYKELFLHFNRADPSTGTITSPELLEEYQLHHYFLQSVRVPMDFETEFPASIIVFETQAPPDSRMQWDFSDEIQSLFIACRLGKVGIIAVLQDGGAQNDLFNYFEDVLDMPLHPLQFREIVAQIKYKSLLFQRTPKYTIIEDNPIKVLQLPSEG